MAKRRRLAPALTEFLEGEEESTRPGLAPLGRAPIAQVAAETAALAALKEVSAELRAAGEEGRMVLRLPLEAIVEDYLIRDRIEAEPEALAALVQSLRSRGQQTPVEVSDLGQGRYGLISGWRRLVALRGLWAETGESRFATVQALLRKPEAGADPYVAMVEENEIRAGLSFYERARIVMRATEAGIFADERQALQSLFSTGSAPRRSKIKSFIQVVRALDGSLRFPARIPERLGLALVKAIEADEGFAPGLRARLAEEAPATAEEETALLNLALRGTRPGRVAAPPVALRLHGRAGRAVIEGPGVDDGFLARLEAWLRQGG